jgi:cytotoxic protein
MDTKIDGRYTEAMIDELDWHEPTIADSVVQQDGGRLDEDGVVIAGAALVITLLSDLLQALSADRKVAIAINNYTDRALAHPHAFTDSGGIHSINLEVAGGLAGFISAEKTKGPIARGTVGVVGYILKGLHLKLVIMWQVPFDYTLYSNYFKLAVISSHIAIDKTLFKDMYFDKHQITLGNAQKAEGGTGIRHCSGYELEGVMGSSGEATLNTSIRMKPC